MYELKNKDKFATLLAELQSINETMYKNNTQIRSLIYNELQHILDTSDPSCGINQIWIGTDLENLSRGRIFVSFVDDFNIEDFYDASDSVGRICIYDEDDSYDVLPDDGVGHMRVLFKLIGDFIRCIASGGQVFDTDVISNALIENGITVYRN